MDEEFVKQLSIETKLSYQESLNVVQYLSGRFELEAAKDIYLRDGYFPFMRYVNLLYYCPIKCNRE